MTASQRKKRHDAPVTHQRNGNKPERRCLVTGERRPTSALVRFVVGPEDEVVPDIDGKLPGRGLWVGARREHIEQAVKTNAFTRAARRPVRAHGDLPDLVEQILAKRVLAALGLACRSGQATVGFERVSALLQKGRAAFLIEASDGSPHGREKIMRLARSSGQSCPILGCFSAQELGLAMGRDNVVHAAVSQGGFARRMGDVITRLEGFRPICPPAWAAD